MESTHALPVLAPAPGRPPGNHLARPKIARRPARDAMGPLQLTPARRGAATVV